MTICRCGKPTHPLYGNRCEDCWALDNRILVTTDMRYLHRAVGGEGDDKDALMISNQGPRSRRWKRNRK